LVVVVTKAPARRQFPARRPDAEWVHDTANCKPWFESLGSMTSREFIPKIHWQGTSERLFSQTVDFVDLECLNDEARSRAETMAGGRYS
jgi:hypothetical protein